VKPVVALRRFTTLGAIALLTVTGCAFQGLNSLPLPGTVGQGSGDTSYRVEISNVGSLEQNSPVLLGDVVVGSVGKMSVKNWHAVVDLSVLPNVTIPANAVARIGQTSLLGSQHLALDPPVGEQPVGRLQPGATIALAQSATYPSTEQTLSALAAVVNSGGLGQIGDVIHNFTAALSGNEGEVRDLLSRIDTFVGTLDDQRDSIIATIEKLNLLTGTFAAQRDVLARALKQIPPALEVLVNQEPRFVSAMQKLGQFSDLASKLVNDAGADLVTNVRNLEPAIKALADVGPDIGLALAYVPVYPYGQNIIDRAVRGDYFNLFSVFDLTVPRLKRGLLVGTRWGQEGMSMVPAPGDAGYDHYYSTHPLAPPGIPPPPPGDPSRCEVTIWICTIPYSGFPAQPPGAAPAAPPAATPAAPQPAQPAPADQPVPAEQVGPPSPGSGG
jgi:phospholipid/cholesterol/gamma-HCH transport system substrate-binding protein